MKNRLTENPIKKYARRMLREGSIDEAEASLAAKDVSDRLQDMVEEVSKMVNDELPKLVDKIRGTYGQDQANAYQQTANDNLNDLLNVVKEKKASLEQAVLVMTGDAQASNDKTELGFEDEDEDGDEDGSAELDADFDKDFGQASGSEKKSGPLGRTPRISTEESRKFNKVLIEAKIIALHKALNETDKKKFPVRARRLAEELNRVATRAIKEAAKDAKLKNSKKTSKDMLKPVKESEQKKVTCVGCSKKFAEDSPSFYKKNAKPYCSLNCFKKNSKKVTKK
jgi:hypothetical protein